MTLYNVYCNIYIEGNTKEKGGIEMRFNLKKCISNMATLAGAVTIIGLIVWYITALVNQYVGYINYINK